MRIKITARQARALGIAAGPARPQGRPASRNRDRRTASRKARGQPPDRLLSLDPSSTAVGWASFRAGVLAEVGLIRSACEDPRDRIRKLAASVKALVVRLAPEVVVIETVSGLHHRAQKLAVSTCSFAQGAIWQAIEDTVEASLPSVICVKEIDWTAGRPKSARARLVYLGEPIYRQFAGGSGDRGFDVADAVGLGRWYLGQIH